MRTNIEIDDELLNAARAILGTQTKKETVEVALKRVVNLEEQRVAFESLRGIGWIGDLEADRTDRLS
ncbi:MAG: type II toxin-antitoxin system VapB family antitoxin [Solirubrobacteraceae bacterium]